MPENQDSGLRVGTLHYRSLGKLIEAGAYLMLALLATNLMGYKLYSTLLPLLLDKQGFTSSRIALIMSTIPSMLTFVICPIISTASDKTRTRFGRRMPYLAISAPVVTLFLMLIPWSGQIAALFPGEPPKATAILMATLTFCFQVAFLIPGSMLYYVAADIIPHDHVGRFTAVSSILGTGLTALFNYCLLKRCVENPRLWFTVIGGLFLMATWLLCLRVKEGEYPPVEDNPQDSSNALGNFPAYIRLYFRECYSHPLYVLLFLGTALNQASTVCRNTFNLLFATKSLKMDAGQYGKVIGVGAVLSALMLLPLGRLMDRIHPLRMYIVSGIVVIAVNAWGYFFVHSYQTFYVIGVMISLVYAIQNMAGTPMLICLVPTDKYGQFASANSMVNCLVMFPASYLGGVVIEHLGYQMIFAWDFLVTILATIAMLCVYRSWQKLGGPHSYSPPRNF